MWHAFVATAVLSALGIGLVLWLRRATDLPVSYFTRDVASIGRLPPYAGVLSQLGALFWAGIVAVSCIGVRLMSQLDGPRSRVRFLLATGGLALLLLVDDVFQIHEHAHLIGLSDRFCFATYALAALAYVVFFHREIRRFEFPVLLVAFGALAVSLAFDNYPVQRMVPLPVFSQHAYEDGAKFAGIVGWFVYTWRLVRHSVVEAVPRR